MTNKLDEEYKKLTETQISNLKLNIDWAFDPEKYPEHAKMLIAKKHLGYKQLSKNVWEIDGDDPLAEVIK